MEEEDSIEKQENFSDDPEQNLHIENELLKIKLQAERGAYFGETDNDLPPEVEEEFLKNVQRFEEEWEKRKTIKVYDLIGKPEFRSADSLSTEDVETELKKIEDLMAEKGVVLGVRGEYEPVVIYRFITEELFDHETDDMLLPGWTRNFTYEEFHPNHKMDIEQRAKDFLEHWFERNFHEYCTELNKQFITLDGKTFSGEEVREKLNSCLSFYSSFTDIKYHIDEVKFEFNEDHQGLGHAEGAVQYSASLENGEAVTIEGPFKLYMSSEYDYWQIFYFVFPGFSW